MSARDGAAGAVVGAARRAVVFAALLGAGALVGCRGCAGDIDDAGRPLDAGAADDAGRSLDAGAADDGGLDACGQAPGQLFGPTQPWNARVDEAPLDDESDAIIGYLQANHATDARFQIDFSFEVLQRGGAPRVPFTPTDDFYEGDCDPAPVPLPEGGALEGEDGYACTTDGDCHLIVVDQPECRLYEMWRANVVDGTFSGGCLAVWDLDRAYDASLRGEQCTSADAAGLPIAPLLFTADEVVAGEVPHALRFILPNAHIRDTVYVHPATHSTGATSGGSSAPPYGARLRLKADADLSALSPAARVVAVALRRYGMILADGGNLTFTARSDRSTTRTWAEAGLGPHDLKALQWSDFEVVAGGERFTWDGSCTRTPVTD